jgi:phosphohistidine swiveling domain-containing protein
MPIVPRLVWLDEADAQNPALVGAKASRLARARALGLPVLNGFVVPVGISRPVIAQAESVLDVKGNSGTARTSIYNGGPAPILDRLAEQARLLGNSLVVRSSSQAEGEGVWAGAFSSYLGLRPEEVVTGVIGCWASVFTPDALNRGQMAGIRPLQVGMAVLVQPQIQPAFGGVAGRGGDGVVTVGATSGHPTAIVAGWEQGHLAVITPEGEVGSDRSSPISPRLLRQVGELTRVTWEKTGFDHIEWIQGQDGQLHLLQAQPKADVRRHGPDARPPEPNVAAEPWMANVARMMVRYPGPVGERFVWPWAVGLENLSPAPTGATPHSSAALAKEIRENTARLMTMRWGEADSLLSAESAWDALRNGDHSPMGDLIASSPSVQTDLAGEHLRRFAQLGRALTDLDIIPHPGWAWYLDLDCPDRPHTGENSPIRRISATFWDAWMYGVTTSLGETITGIPAAGGWGVGRLRVINNPDDAALFSPREVIATPQPVGNIAPLLWNAAGLITAEGSPGAHLFEVAEWLAVPALCGVDISQWTGGYQTESGQVEGLIVALNGERGRVTRLP